MGDAAQPSRPPLELAVDIDVAFKARDWAGLRRLYHDRSLLCTVAAHERVVAPDELMEVFDALEGTPYSIGATHVAPVGDDAVVASGQLRYPLEHGGIADAHRAWLLTFKDGLVWRSCFYRSEAEALRAYDELGI